MRGMELFMSNVEIFGYIATVITAVSIMMNNIWLLRWYNMAGSAMLGIYSVLMHAYPVAVANFLIVLVDIYYIWKLHTDKDMFSLLEISAADSQLLPRFLKMYGEDINKSFPDFKMPEKINGRSLFILRNLSPVGLFIFEDEGSGTAGILLDYVIPSHRDLNNARFFFNESRNLFIDAGFREFVFRNPSRNHTGYLKKMNFTDIGSNTWVKTLITGKDIKPASK